MSMTHHRRAPSRRSVLDGVNLVSLAVLFIALIAAALMLIGTAVRGSSPLLLVVPVVLGTFAILDLRER